MQNYTVEEARNIVMNLSKKYEANLNRQSYLIVYRDRSTNGIKHIEIKFTSANFQHLTGVELIDSKGKIRHNVASLFYSKCIKNKLKKGEIAFKSDGTTPLKLNALPVLIDIQKVTKIAGDYNNQRTYLVADKLIGNVNFCLGLKEIDNEFYVPVSALLEDIKKLSENQSQVLVILSKLSSDKLPYQHIRYVAKGVDFGKLQLTEETKSMISERVLVNRKG